MYLLVLIGGSSIFFMLTVEYRENKLLIENNRILMRNTVVKTLTNNIATKVTNYPLSADDINSSWNKLPLSFLANSEGEWIFPSRFLGSLDSNLSKLWTLYELDDEALDSVQTQLSLESKLRIKALNRIKKSLNDDDKSTVPQHVKTYFSLVENYQLSELEEIISNLRFLQLKDTERWNRELTQLIVFDGSRQIKSLSNYLFRNNQRLSKKDMNLAIKKIRSILEKANIDTSWFDTSTTELWTPNLTIDIKTLANYSILQNKWITIEADEKLVLLIPFSFESELNAVENQLKLQGILDDEDRLSIKEIDSNDKVKVLQNLPIIIKKPAWNRQLAKQNYFLMTKIVLTLIFMLSLFIVVAFVSYKNRKKMELVNLKENFINLVSHELKTPLASIRLMIETIQKRQSRNLSIKDYPDKIIEEVDRLWLMVDNILSLNQIKSGELELNIDSVNVKPLVQRVYDKFNEFQSKEIILRNNVDRILAYQVDPLLFELVIINLFSNAIKYCNKKTVCIEISASLNPNRILLTDNASGIKELNWNKIFDDFYRENKSKTKQGTGVGLSLCRQIMNIHKGSITVKKSDEKGTTWEIELPDIEKDGGI